MKLPVIVVTGVSTGIGYATTRAAVAMGMYVFGSVRNEADAARLKIDFPQHFTPLIFDVTDHGAIQAAVPEVAQVLGSRRLAGLINNAGIVVAGPLLEVSMEQLRHQFEVNLFGLLAVTQAFAPLLGTDPAREGSPGRIVNLSSVSGKIAFPFIGPYVASKHALEGLSSSLRRELMMFGIDVIVVGPGAVRTPIWTKSKLEQFAQSPYAAVLDRMKTFMTKVGENGLDVEDCADLLVNILSAPRPKARYALVRNALANWMLPRWLPQRWLDRAIQRRLGLKGPSATI